MSFKVDEDTKKKLKEMSDKYDMSVSALIRKAIKDLIQKEKE